MPKFYVEALFPKIETDKPGKPRTQPLRIEVETTDVINVIRQLGMMSHVCEIVGLEPIVLVEVTTKKRRGAEYKTIEALAMEATVGK